MNADDEAWVSEAMAGDSKAFARLVERYERPLYNLALRILRNREDARDVTQTAFVKAFEKRGSFDPSRKFFSWIYRIALNESMNLLARQRARALVELDPPARGRSPEEEFDHAVRRERIEVAIESLPVDLRVVIALRHVVELSYREIASVLDLPEETVKSRLFSARRRLREMLQESSVGKEI